MKIFQQILSSVNASGSPASVVGIDIGSSSIKVVELVEKQDVLTLSTYGEIQLGPYVGKPVGQAVTLEPKQEQAALVDVIRESAVQGQEAVFAMPLSSSFVTNVSLDADADTNLGALVRVEARKVIPASLSEVTLDWAEVEVSKVEAEQADRPTRNVLIAAIQNSALERFKILMQFAGLTKPPTEIECFSAIRALHFTNEPDMALIDIGATSSKLYIAHKGLLMRMHRIRAGGTVATQKIAQALDVDFDVAEERKFQADAAHSDFAHLKQAHNKSYERPFREFQQVIREYERRTGISIQRVYLSGGGALFPGMPKLLSEAVDREVVLANPFQKVSYPAFIDDTVRGIGPSFTVALGAALRAFDG